MIELAEEIFTRYSSARPDAPPTRAGDLYLTCACANGDSSAIAAFQESYFQEVDATVRRLDAGEAPGGGGQGATRPVWRAHHEPPPPAGFRAAAGVPGGHRGCV